MASRGSVSKNGHITTNEYHQVGELIHGAKVLEGNGNNHGLPDYSHSPNSIYIKIDKADGMLRMMRVYDDKGNPVLEIGYHFEKKYSKNGNDKVLHYHYFDKNLNRIGWFKLNHSDSIYMKYKDILKEFNL